MPTVNTLSTFVEMKKTRNVCALLGLLNIDDKNNNYNNSSKNNNNNNNSNNNNIFIKHTQQKF